MAQAAPAPFDFSFESAEMPKEVLQRLMLEEVCHSITRPSSFSELTTCFSETRVPTVHRQPSCAPLTHPGAYRFTLPRPSSTFTCSLSCSLLLCRSVARLFRRLQIGGIHPHVLAWLRK